MPRKRRLEFAGAVYHVISRGNYRAHVFAEDTTKAAFLLCLDEACVRAGWIVHAWCVMSNHYHLCLETPRANLVGGMRWLQGTFAVRFNRLRREHGHLFQGRYHALPVAPERVGAVCHYIHLNPVRARLIPAVQLADWRWTSIAQLFHPATRPGWLSCQQALTHAGGLADTSAGRRTYLEYLDWLQADDACQKKLQFERMSCDWAVGSRDFKMTLLQAHGQIAGTRIHHAEQQGLAEPLWHERLARYMAAMTKAPADAQTEAKGAPWKVVIASAMKRTTTATNPWLAAQLQMGSPFRLSRLVSECRRHPEAFEPWVRRSAKCKG